MPINNLYNSAYYTQAHEQCKHGKVSIILLKHSTSHFLYCYENKTSSISLRSIISLASALPNSLAFSCFSCFVRSFTAWLPVRKGHLVALPFSAPGPTSVSAAADNGPARIVSPSAPTPAIGSSSTNNSYSLQERNIVRR